MDMNQALASEVDVAIHKPAAATDAVVTITAPVANTGRVVYFYGAVFSGDQAPAAPITATVAGPAVTLSMYIPATVFLPLGLGMGTHPVKCAAGANLVVTLPSLGGTASGTLIVFYKIGAA